MPRLDDHCWSCSCAQGARHRGLPGAGAGGLAAKVGDMLSPAALAARRGPDPDPAPARGSHSPGAGGRGAGGGPPGSWHHHLVQRSLVLFSVGVVLALVLNLLQVQRNVTLFPEEVIATIFSSAWWVPPCCGTAAGECSGGPRGGGEGRGGAGRASRRPGPGAARRARRAAVPWPSRPRIGGRRTGERRGLAAIGRALEHATRRPPKTNRHVGRPGGGGAPRGRPALGRSPCGLAVDGCADLLWTCSVTWLLL